MKRLVLIDGSNVMFRAYFATAYTGNLMQNSKGQYTNAVFAFVNMINKLLTEDFTHFVVAFDKGSQTFRHEAFEEYKAGRPPIPEEFRSQIDLIKQSLDVLGVLHEEIELIEADDIIGTLTTKYYDEFDEIEILSNDKDLLQLINDKVTLRTTKRGNKPDFYYTPEILQQTMGITPDQVTDLKGLMGDSSDNLPGVPRVGEKTGVKLLNEFDTLEHLLANTNELTGKLKENIINHQDTAKLCKQLATIKRDVDLDFTLDDMEYKGVNEDEMIAFFEKLELHSLIKRYHKNNGAETIDFSYKIVRDVYELEEYLIDESTLILETFGTNYHHADILGLAIVNRLGHVFVPFSLMNESLALHSFLGNKEIKKNVFDVKMMRVVLNRFNFPLEGVEFDLLLAAYILNPNNTKDDFRVIVANFDYTQVHYQEEVYKKGSKYSIPKEEEYALYAVQKAIAITQLKDDLLQQLRDADQISLLFDIEQPVANVLAMMEYHGITVDHKMLEELDLDLKQRIAEKTVTIHELAGEEFNVSSPQQLGVILFEKLELPHGKKTKTGYSTSIKILNKLKDDHDIIQQVITYRKLTKLHSTYVKGLYDAIHEDGRIHTIYRQAFTSTGRLSSIEPNLQNIPIKYEEGRQIRKVFVPRDNHVLIALDYSQIELRVLAHMAHEETMIKAFNNNDDIHSKTAQIIFEKEEISSKERAQAKTVNFGIIYGQSPWGLSKELNIPKKEAEQFIDTYYKRFPGIKGFMDSVIEQGENKGYVETLYNRRRYIPELKSSVYMQKEAGKRNAMNAPIQGTAADILKIAMVQIDQKMKENNFQSKLLLQIHDELVFDVVKEELKEMTQLIKETMEQCVSLDVPLKVDYAVGDNLYETK